MLLGSASHQDDDDDCHDDDHNDDEDSDHYYHNSQRVEFNATAVTSIFASVYGGNDHVYISRYITLPTIIDGGDGKDYLHGGAGNDVITDPSGDNRIHAGDGHDQIRAGAGIDKIDAGGGDDKVFAGGGSDDVQGGTGNDILLGEGGDDHLAGGDGRDLLIGGFGADRLEGSADDDVLVGGDYDLDHNGHSDSAAEVAALDLIFAEWISSHDYATRVANVTNGANGKPLTTRANGNFFLQMDLNVFDDDNNLLELDNLLGGAGDDLYILGTNDKINGVTKDETIIT